MFLESTCGIIALLAVAQRALTAADPSLGAEQARFRADAASADAASADAASADAASLDAHPHARTVRLERRRRPGMVAPRPAHCLSPIGAARAAIADS